MNAKECIDFECQVLADFDACSHKDELYNPRNLFSCKDCVGKECINCTKKDRCENVK